MSEPETADAHDVARGILQGSLSALAAAGQVAEEAPLARVSDPSRSMRYAVTRPLKLVQNAPVYEYTFTERLAAKPVIDIQVSVADLDPLDLYRQPLASIGYAHVPPSLHRCVVVYDIRGQRVPESYIDKLRSAFEGVHELRIER